MEEYKKEKSKLLASAVFEFLEDSHEQDFLSEVSNQLNGLLKKENLRGDTIVVTSVVKLNDKEKKSIQDFFVTFLSKRYPVNNIVNKSILGGIKLEWGDVLLDMTIKNRLTSLRRQLLE